MCRELIHSTHAYVNIYVRAVSLIFPPYSNCVCSAFLFIVIQIYVFHMCCPCLITTLYWPRLAIEILLFSGQHIQKSQIANIFYKHIEKSQ
ncbi:hypothetical protein GDO78_005181 [Eleutherodactylus coqui]|uniref:Uncharacterized protein n=1 Tax=Eleutherodactylus coqui TaxID=57060 RepID=A0A8J6FJQ0_ELECQ|nr:hypothetical protein GDO78_005181 [Eleutherodactylus coqui]